MNYKRYATALWGKSPLSYTFKKLINYILDSIFVKYFLYPIQLKNFLKSSMISIIGVRNSVLFKVENPFFFFIIWGHHENEDTSFFPHTFPGKTEVHPFLEA